MNWETVKSWLDEFWALVVAVWQESLFGIQLGPMIVALSVFFLALTVRRLFAVIIIGSVRKITEKTKTKIDDAAIEAVEGPLKFVPVIFGLFVSIKILRLNAEAEAVALQFVESLVAITIFWSLYNMIRPLGVLFHKLDRVLGAALVEWIMTVLKVVIVLMGGAAVLQVWGIDVVPLIAGFGLLGVAVALGAQDMFKNLIAGITLLVEKRFNKGDWVYVDGVVEGIVEKIGLRSSLVRRFDKAPVFVPNAHLADNPMTNFTAMTYRRIYWKIGVEYRTTREQLEEVCTKIEEYIMGNRDFAHPPEVPTFIKVDSFNASSIDIMVYCFTVTTQWGEWLKIREQLAYKIKEIVEGAGTAFAFPSQSLYLETVPEPFGQAEVFAPPQKQLEDGTRDGAQAAALAALKAPAPQASNS